MKRIAFIIASSGLAMQETPHNSPIKEETKFIYVDESLEKLARFESSKSIREPLEHSDFIKALKVKSPELFNEKNYNIKFRSTFRGACFEVFAKTPKDIQQEIEDAVIEHIKKEHNAKEK